MSVLEMEQLCKSCDKNYDFEVEDEQYCQDCYYDKFFYCNGCENHLLLTINPIIYEDDHDDVYCIECCRKTYPNLIDEYGDILSDECCLKYYGEE